MIHLEFELTASQIKRLKPALDAAKKAHDEDKTSPGMVLLRLDRPSEAVFLPHKYAIEINKIMNAFAKADKP